MEEREGGRDCAEKIRQPPPIKWQRKSSADLFTFESPPSIWYTPSINSSSPSASSRPELAWERGAIPPILFPTAVLLFEEDSLLGVSFLNKPLVLPATLAGVAPGSCRHNLKSTWQKWCNNLTYYQLCESQKKKTTLRNKTTATFASLIQLNQRKRTAC